MDSTDTKHDDRDHDRAVRHLYRVQDTSHQNAQSTRRRREDPRHEGPSALRLLLGTNLTVAMERCRKTLEQHQQPEADRQHQQLYPSTT